MMSYINLYNIYTYCELSYKEPEEIILGEYNIDDYIFLDNKETDCQCYFFIDNLLNHIYIVFRGTSSFKDILTDLYVIQSYHNYKTKVHKGFLEQYLSLKKSIEEILYNFRDDYKIICCGHSLGGALAILLAFDYKYDCITIGAPRVGDKNFKKEFNKRVKNILCLINNFDIVPTIPKINYKHVVKGYSIFTNKYKEKTSFFNKFKCIKNIFNIECHQIQYYKENTDFNKINDFLNKEKLFTI